MSLYKFYFRHHRFIKIRDSNYQKPSIICIYQYSYWKREQFAGFSADSLAERIYDCQAKIVLTVFAFWRGTKLIELKNIIEDALQMVETKFTYTINKCIVLSHINTVATANSGDPKVRVCLFPIHIYLCPLRISYNRTPITQTNG